MVMVITLIVGAIFTIACATMALLALVMLQSAEYDQWVREFESNGGISWGLGEVLDGNQVVSHTVLGERRSKTR